MFTQKEKNALNKAAKIIESKVLRTTDILTNTAHTKTYCQNKLVSYDSEVFAVLYLDNRNRLIHYAELFFGTIDGASVYPREVVKSTLEHNAAAVIFVHNHPSGIAEPSRADMQITKRLKDALSFIDVRVLDHVVVGTEGVISFAERGLL